MKRLDTALKCNKVVCVDANNVTGRCREGYAAGMSGAHRWKTYFLPYVFPTKLCPFIFQLPLERIFEKK